MPKLDHQQSVGEELFSSITHGIGALFGAGLVIILLKFSRGSFIKTLTLATFGSLFFFLYLSSTLAHALSFTRAKKVFQIIDHAAIYLFIAATYTPFVILVVGGVAGWLIFTLIWALTVFGIIYKTLFLNRHPRLSLALYLAMGWCAILVAGPLFVGLSVIGFWLLLAGGLFYSFGAIFFALKKLKFNHGIWHIFVLLGSLCHLLSLLTI